MTSNKYILNSDDELCKFNATLYTVRHELWKTEEKCRIKKKSIEKIEYATIQAEIKNEFIEKQLQFTKSKIEEIRDSIVCMDEMIMSQYDTLALLEVQHDKRVYSINQSKKDYELQLFIKTELWRKEEERLNNIPEIKSLNIANSELENTKLELEELLKHHEKLIEKIAKAEEENNRKRNDIVIHLVTLYVDNLSLDENIENDKSLLRKLKEECQEKLNIKNALLESRKDKINKVSHWTQIPCLLDSNMLDLKIDSLDEDLKLSFNHDISLQQKLVTKFSMSSNKPQNKDHGILDINDNTHSSNAGIPSHFSPLKTYPQFDINVNQNLRNISLESKTVHFDCNDELVNKDNLDFQSKKRKANEVQADFEFKKPSNLLQEQIQDTVKNDNLKDIQKHKKDKITEHQKSVIPFNDTLTDSTEQSNINATSEKTKMVFDFATALNNEGLSENINKSFSDLGCDDDNSDMDCSKTSSLFDPEFFEMYKSTYNNQHQFTQSNIMNSDNSCFSFQSHESNSTRPKQKTHQELGNGIFQQLHSESDTTPNEASSSKEFKMSNEPYQSHFMSSDLFR